MRLLLDTHILLWWLATDKRLHSQAMASIEDGTNEILVSSASIWEISVKKSLGKLDISLDELQLAIQENDFEPLPITIRHACQYSALPILHRDPFDRMLIAQSLSEPHHLLTQDKALAQYGPTVMVL